MIKVRPDPRVQRFIFLTVDEFLIEELAALLEAPRCWLGAFLASHDVSDLIESTFGEAIQRYFWLL